MNTFCFILTQSLESPGGIGRYFPLAKALVKKGFGVEIIALHHDYKNAVQTDYFIEGVRVHYVGQMHVLKKDNNKLYFGILKFIWIILCGTLALTYSAFKTKALVIVICKAQPMNTIAALSAKFIRKKAVLLDADDYEKLNNRFKYKWQQLIVAYFEKLAYRKSDLVFVSNTYLYELAQRFGVKSERIILLPHGYDSERFNLVKDEHYQKYINNFLHAFDIPINFKVVLFVGSISLLTHALDLLLEAFTIVLGQIENVILVLAGRGEDSESLKSLVKDYDIADHVRFVGFVNPADVPYLFGLSYLSCDPKKEGELPKSTLSLKLIESIASGTPCITADIGDSKQVIDGAGLTFPPGNSSELASAMLTLIQDEELHYQMQRNAERIRDKFSWNHLADSFIASYEQYC